MDVAATLLLLQTVILTSIPDRLLELMLGQVQSLSLICQNQMNIIVIIIVIYHLAYRLKWVSHKYGCRLQLNGRLNNIQNEQQ